MNLDLMRVFNELALTLINGVMRTAIEILHFLESFIVTITVG